MTAVKKTQQTKSKQHRTSRRTKSVRKHAKRIQFARATDGAPGNPSDKNG
jgi:hypothetical protein